MSTCIIHVGMHKTGTTSIQQSLNGFSDDKFYYARLDQEANHSLPMFSLFSPSPEKHHLHRANGRKGRALEKYIDDVKLDLKQSIAEANGRTMIISGEDISNLSAAVLVSMYNHLSQYFKSIMIIAYVRPPASYMTSSFQEKVKGGLGVMNIDSLYRNYKKNFSKLDDIFGRENVHLSKFNPRAFPDNCVVSDFCSTLGMPSPKRRSAIKNESMSLAATSFFYKYNNLTSSSPLQQLKPYVVNLLSKQLGLDNARKFRFASKLLTPILDANRDDIKWMEDRIDESLKEELPKYQAGDISDESDLLRIDRNVIDELISWLGKLAPKNVTGYTSEDVDLLLYAMGEKYGLKLEQSNLSSKSKSKSLMSSCVRIHRAEPGIIAGWATGSDPNEPVKISLFVNGKEIAHTLADKLRKPLRDRGVHPSGRCGFIFKFKESDHLKIDDVISIQVWGDESARGSSSKKVAASKHAKKKALKHTPVELPKNRNLKKLQTQMNRKKEIILHDGHGKTGSSYLQSALALSKDRLELLGIDYPTHPSFTAAKSGFISSGNVSAGENWLIRMAENVMHSKQNKVLFSHEGLFLQILAHNLAFVETFKDFKVKIILFIRNPVCHMLSTYGQRVKRSRLVDTINDDAKKYVWVKRVDQFIDVCKKLNFELRVINYSNKKHQLSSVFEDALSIPINTLKLPPKKNVNRSLSASEMELQRLFNLHYDGNSAKFISDVLCNQLPDVEAERVNISGTEAARFVNRLSDDVEEVNKKLDPDCQYSLSVDDFVSDQHTGNAFTFNREQLEVLVKSICAQLGGGES